MKELIEKYQFKKVKDIGADIYLLELEDVKLYIYGNEHYKELSVTTKKGCYNMSTTICINNLKRMEKLIRAFLPDLDLQKMEDKLNDSLEKESSESMLNWLNQCRVQGQDFTNKYK